MSQHPEVSPEQKTIFDQVDAIMDAMFGPSEYSYVAIMNSVADRLSERGFAVATTNPELAYALCKASAEIGEAAEKRDRVLVSELNRWFGSEVAQ
jgi:hypothetical protein